MRSPNDQTLYFTTLIHIETTTILSESALQAPILFAEPSVSAINSVSHFEFSSLFSLKAAIQFSEFALSCFNELLFKRIKRYLTRFTISLRFFYPRLNSLSEFFARPE